VWDRRSHVTTTISGENFFSEGEKKTLAPPSFIWQDPGSTQTNCGAGK